MTHTGAEGTGASVASAAGMLHLVEPLLALLRHCWLAAEALLAGCCGEACKVAAGHGPAECWQLAAWPAH